MNRTTYFYLLAGLLVILSIRIAPTKAALSPSNPSCTYLAGTGDTLRIVIVPAAFDDAIPNDVASFESLTTVIAQAFVDTEPYASNMDRITISRANDYSGKDIDVWTGYDVWYSQTLIDAAGICDYNQIIVVAHNSGWAGGGFGYYSVVGSGTPPTCNPVTCTGNDCPWTNSCSWDENIGFTALHETGHTFAGLRHTCYSTSYESSLLDQMERIQTLSGYAPNIDDPVNCGIGFTGDPDIVCTEWDSSDFLTWQFPADPNFGCYQGCDNRPEWYRAWDNTPNIMCVDTYLENGFTPVERKLLYDATQCLAINTAVEPLEIGLVVPDPSPNCLWDQYKSGTEVNLTAYSYYYGWEFSHWSGDITGTSNPITITLDSTKNITAHFQESCYSLNSDATPIGRGYIDVIPDPNCNGGKYTPYTNVALLAVPAVSWEFSHWSGDITGTSNPITITLDSIKNITAHFQESCYSLNSDVIPIDSGHIDVTPDPNCDIDKYSRYTNVTLLAVPAGSWEFSHWSGDITGTNNPIVLTVDSNKSFVANFENITYIPFIVSLIR